MAAEQPITAPLVSVILPFYNAPFLEDAIESILNQTYRDFELLLINNGSTDSSHKVAETYANDPRVQLLDEPRRGVVYAANAGINASRGTYIARMDADDISFSNRLALQVEFLEKNPKVGVISGCVEYLGNVKQNEGFVHYIEWLNAIKSEKDIDLNRFIEFPVANPTLMFRKELFEKYGLFHEGNFPEDYELFLRMTGAGVTFGKLSESILQWRDSRERLTRTDSRYSAHAFFKIKAKYLAAWLQKNNNFHPEIWIWGAGRLSRRRSEWLIDHGVDVVKYIDFKEGENTIRYQDIPEPGSCFIVSYVGNRGARDEIKSYLIQQGYREGLDFILAS